MASSIPVSVNSPQSNIAAQIAQLAAALGVQVFNWAQSQYQVTSNVTDQAINNFLTTSQIGLGAAQQMLSQYENVTVPEINQLASMAAEYNSPARISLNMGAAESDAAQKADAARLNAIQNLESYGVDPSSGMYANLERTANTQAGAAEAGAGQQAQINTANTGRQLLEQSILQGQQLPGDVVNSLNSAFQGISGAENSALGRLNAGTAAQGAAAPYFQSAIALRYPPTGQASNSGAGGGGGGVRQPQRQQPQQRPQANYGGGGSNQSGRPGGQAPSKGFKMISGAGLPQEDQNQNDPAFQGGQYGAGAIDPTGAGYNEYGPAAAYAGAGLGNDPFAQQFAGWSGGQTNPVTSTQSSPMAPGVPMSDANSYTGGSFNAPGSTFGSVNATPGYNTPAPVQNGSTNVDFGAQQAGGFNTSSPDWQTGAGFINPGGNQGGFDPNTFNAGFDPSGFNQGAFQPGGGGWGVDTNGGFDPGGFQPAAFDPNAGDGNWGDQWAGAGDWGGGGGRAGGYAADPSAGGDWQPPGDFGGAYARGGQVRGYAGGGGAYGNTVDTPGGAADFSMPDWGNDGMNWGGEGSGGGSWRYKNMNMGLPNSSNPQVGADTVSTWGGQNYGGATSNEQSQNWMDQLNQGSQDNQSSMGAAGNFQRGFGSPSSPQSGPETNSWQSGPQAASWQGNLGWGGGWARGGMIPSPTTGGKVPMRASPSMGRQQDDVKANLNAGEFVIPRDVAAFKGQEFFHKLIAQARKHRVTGGKPPSTPVGGQPSRQLPGPTRFNSRPMQRPQGR